MKHFQRIVTIRLAQNSFIIMKYMLNSLPTSGRIGLMGFSAKPLSEIVRDAMKEWTGSDAELSRQSGVPPNSLSMFKNRKQGLGVEYLRSLCQVLKVDPSTGKKMFEGIEVEIEPIGEADGMMVFYGDGEAPEPPKKEKISAAEWAMIQEIRKMDVDPHRILHAGRASLLNLREKLMTAPPDMTPNLAVEFEGLNSAIGILNAYIRSKRR